MIALDIGCHHGCFTLILAWQITDAGPVYAIEPAVDHLEIVQESLAAKGLTGVTPLLLAIGEGYGDAQLRMSPNDS